MREIDLQEAGATARAAVEAAAAASLVHFRRGVRVETKPDRTLVTAADRDAEAAIFGVIRARFPDHALLGEETGAHEGADAEARWIVDPLDGTRGFTRGGSFWGPLVALEHRGVVVAGAMALPALGETYWAARGLGAFRRVGEEPPERLAVSGITDLADATLSLGEPRCLLAPPLGERVTRLALSAAQARCYGDLAGCALVLTGRAEAWIEAGVQIWDIAALAVLVEEAGGRFTDFEGRPTVASGHCVASNGILHERVLAALA
ncbi:inositol monophosphatase family protein [Polyangium fumosum]|uniref:Inositol phosphatase n=1 Tax=Polyangium fumosum TaxID=889272 RepID=A0A4U1J0X4_9BACT|nr:inositol monophosphatase family protein [Polyangium fumosum]TKD00562.1 inositol phosphatase [Polyangium fumosum]